MHSFTRNHKGSDVENFYPAGWDLEKLHNICTIAPEKLTERQDFWHPDFQVIPVENREEWHMRAGHDMAMRIKKARDEGKKIALILPVGPVGQYRWCAWFIKSWGVKCDHVYGFNMDDWADAEGNISGVFGPVMEKLFYNELGEYTIPESQRNFATKENLPTYEEKLAAIQKEGGEVVLVHGVGRDLHVAFSEPHWAADHEDVESYKKECYRIAGKLHPLTIEQNSLLTFMGNFTAASAYGNTICMGLMMRSDYAIGGCSSGFTNPNETSSWQGLGLRASLRYGPDMWVPCSFLPTMPGKFYYVKSLAEMGGMRVK